MDNVYRSLMEASSLSNAHLKWWAGRGVRRETLIRADIGTTSAARVRNLVKELQKQLGSERLLDVPGFFINRKGNLFASVRISWTGGRAPNAAYLESLSQPLARTLDALQSGGRGSARRGWSESLTDLAARAGLTPPVCQGAVMRLASDGVIEAKGQGVLADVILRADVLSEKQLKDLQKSFEIRARTEAAHLDE